MLGTGLFDSIPLEVLQSDATTLNAPPHRSSIFCLLNASNAHEPQHPKDKNRNKNTYRSTNNWVQSCDIWQKLQGIAVPLSEASAGEFDEILQKFSLYGLWKTRYEILHKIHTKQTPEFFDWSHY